MSSDPLSIVTIEDTGLKRRAQRVTFSDGRHYTTSKAVIKELGFEEGTVLTGEPTDASKEDDPVGVLIDRIRDEAPQQAKKRAMYLVAHRDYTISEVEQRLRWDGYSSGVVADVIAHLKEIDLLNDERFIRSFCESRLNAGYGPYVIIRKLVFKGIEDDQAKEALETFIDEEQFDMVQRATLLITKYDLSDRKQYQRALRKLVSRGYSYECARTVCSP